MQAQPSHRQRAEAKGGRFKKGLGLINAMVFTVPASALADLAGDPDVEYVVPDRPVHGTMDYAEPAINADIARQYGWDGTGVTVAVIDSGIMDSHPDLQDPAAEPRGLRRELQPERGQRLLRPLRPRHARGRHPRRRCRRSRPDPGYTRSFWGIAPNVKFVNLRVLDRNGAGTDSMVIAAIQRAIALKTTYNIRIINLSLGRPVMESYTLDPLCQAVERPGRPASWWWWRPATKAATTRNGTSGYGTITSPGNDPYVITVGAMKDDGHAVARRRPDRQLQFQGSDAVRPRRQAGPGGARQPDHRPPCPPAWR